MPMSPEGLMQHSHSFLPTAYGDTAVAEHNTQLYLVIVEQHVWNAVLRRGQR